MTYTSFAFAAFVAATIIIYYLFPLKKYQWCVLLIASAGFYLTFSVRYSAFILFTIVTIWLAGLEMRKVSAETKRKVKENKAVWSREEKAAFKKQAEGKRRALLALALLLNFGVLAALKYFNVYASGLVALLLHLPAGDEPFRLLLPIGISFYTFQSTGYLIDVYREETEAETNPFKLALFISFFPQIVQGPIGDFNALAGQLTAEHKPEWRRFRLGGSLILWGLFRKLIIGDRAAAAIAVFTADPGPFGGLATFFVVLLYALQLYADFAGGIDISRGVAKMLGIDMAVNFRRPYFATSINDYWRRWHITLGEWMKKYVFYTLAVSGPFLKLGKRFSGKTGRALPAAIASFVVFLLVGIWHGSNSRYLAFGIYNGLIVALSTLLAPQLTALREKTGAFGRSFLYRVFQMARTFVLVLIGYYFDLALSARGALFMLKRTALNWQAGLLKEQIKALTLTKTDYMILALAALIVFWFSVRLERTGLEEPGELTTRRPALLQWLIIAAAIVAIVLFGWYGPGYSAAEFVYQQF